MGDVRRTPLQWERIVIFSLAYVLSLVRSEGLEPPRCYSLPPQGSASTNSATSACQDRYGTPDRINGAGCNKSEMEGQGLPERPFQPLFGGVIGPIGRPVAAAASA